MKFTFTINFQGTPLPITLTGKVDGDTMAGKADFGGFAEGDWSAKRSARRRPRLPRPRDDDHHAPRPRRRRVGDRHRLRRQVGRDAEDAGRRHAGQRDAQRHNGKLSGTFGSQLGEVPVAGTVEGKALKLTMVAQTPQGDMTVVMTGDLDGDNIVNGKAEVSGLGQMEWSAKRIKQ